MTMAEASDCCCAASAATASRAGEVTGGGCSCRVAGLTSAAAASREAGTAGGEVGVASTGGPEATGAPPTALVPIGMREELGISIARKHLTLSASVTGGTRYWS